MENKLYTYSCVRTFFVHLIDRVHVIQILYEYSVLDNIIRTRAGVLQDSRQVFKGHLRLFLNAAWHQLLRLSIQAQATGHIDHTIGNDSLTVLQAERKLMLLHIHIHTYMKAYAGKRKSGALVANARL